MVDFRNSLCCSRSRFLIKSQTLSGNGNVNEREWKIPDTRWVAPKKKKLMKQQKKQKCIWWFKRAHLTKRMRKREGPLISDHKWNFKETENEQTSKTAEKMYQLGICWVYRKGNLKRCYVAFLHKIAWKLWNMRTRFCTCILVI